MAEAPEPSEAVALEEQEGRWEALERALMQAQAAGREAALVLAPTASDEAQAPARAPPQAREAEAWQIGGEEVR